MLEIVVLALHERPKGPLGVRHAHAEQAPRLQYPERLPQELSGLPRVSEMLEHVFAIDDGARAVVEREQFPDVEVEVGGIEEVDVHPPRLRVRARSQL